MKQLSIFLALSAIIILFAYISYNELRHRSSPQTMSDEAVATPEFNVESGPLPAISYDLPNNVTFAGEPVPMELPDVRERLDKELQINIYLHSNTIFLIKRANRWLPQMQEILRAHGIPDDFKYLPLIESNLLNVVSPAEAVGYWQILKTSGQEFGLEITNEVDERYNPLKATEAACKYLKQAYRKFGNWTLVAASYNRGMGGIERAIENQREKSYYDLFLNEETSRYVFRIIAIKEIVENPVRYGFKINPKHYYDEEPLEYVEVTETVKSLVDFAKHHGTNYKLIKRHNPWLRDEKLTVKKGRRYKIALPGK
ncbi:transglycosylase SLT domain-containing protein [Fulvivirgaceae bacterium PWU4]|uniref:Transglycosylase SLT domain-containing protein n=1 Tax=Chryseosolibacter histidini TaxID=2782349 RepID=A0AAP2GRB5_9BACT|nr:lytic transglycosylase domain-containing protein [Chryseosolibacter histidini]MBT1699835.1 transglycosylase SLT domain-containing protein [Chryseosolibacter histidini]